MSGINKAIIVGRVGKDPEVKVFQSGGKIASFSLATSEKWKDKSSGETKEKTQWHNVVVKNDALVGIAEKYVKKGDWLYVEGSIETRKWQDQSGADKYTTEIVLSPFNGKINLFGSNSGSGSQSSGGDTRSAVGGGNSSSYGSNAVDDDIPF